MTERKKRLFTIGAFIKKKKGTRRILLFGAAALLMSMSAAAIASGSGLAASGGFPYLLFVGDSLTEGYGVTAQQAFPHLTAEQIKAKGYPKLSYTNAGASGATSSFGPKMVSFQIKKRRPDIVVYALGSNDGLRGVDPGATRKRIESALDILAKHKIPVLLTGQRAAPNYGPRYTAAFDGMYAAIAKERKLPFLPFLLKGVAGDPTLNLADGIHPNPAGHKVIANRVSGALVPLIKALKSPVNQDKNAKAKTATEASTAPSRD